MTTTIYGYRLQGSSVLITVGTLEETEQQVQQGYDANPSHDQVVEVVRVTLVASHTRAQRIAADPRCYLCGRNRSDPSLHCPNGAHP